VQAEEAGQLRDVGDVVEAVRRDWAALLRPRFV